MTTAVDHDWTALEHALTGTLSLPGTAGYEACRPWNLAVAMHPAAVVAVAGAEDVSRVVRWAAAHDLRVAVQAGGHSALPWRSDTVLVVTGHLNDVSIDCDTQVAELGAGVQWGEVIEAAAPRGLLPVCGSAATVGVAGYLTGGGIGPMARTYGISSDHVLAFEVVTGDGEIRRASAEENSDLFWGLRGGKATLGIVTRVVVRLVDCASFYGGAVYVAGDDVATVLRAWPVWAASLPEQATSSVCLTQLPAMPGVPEALAGRTTLAVRLVWVGKDVDESSATALFDGAHPVLGGFATMPAAQLAAVHQDPTDPHPFDTDGIFLDDFPPDAVEALLASAGPGSGTPLVAAEVRQLGGAAHREPHQGDAYNARAAGYHLMTGGVPVPSPEPIRQAAASVIAALQPWWSGRSMANFVVRSNLDALRDFYDDATLTRLSELADRYDPDGVYAVGQVARLGRRRAAP